MSPHKKHTHTHPCNPLPNNPSPIQPHTPQPLIPKEDIADRIYLFFRVKEIRRITQPRIAISPDPKSGISHTS